MSEVHNAIMLNAAAAVNDNSGWSFPAEAVAKPAVKDRSLGAELWESVAVVLALLVAVKLSYDAFTLMRWVSPNISPEGAAAGWWLTASMIWLFDLRRIEAGKGPAPKGKVYGNRALRTYVALVFTVFSVAQIAQQGVSAILGLTVGALTLLTVFAVARLNPN